MAAANRSRRRPVSYRTELEGLIPTFGDLFAVTHDLPRWGLRARVLAVRPRGEQIEITAVGEDMRVHEADRAA